MTANQRYKASGSPLTFKEWLNIEESTNHQYNMADESKNLQKSTPGITVFGIELKYILIGAAAIGGAVWLYKKYSKA
jgi:hypothetical protein